MKEIRETIYWYHIVALALGAVYFYVAMYAFYFMGTTIDPIFSHFQPDPESVVSIAAINGVIAFFGSLLPALILIVSVHIILSPSSKLFLFSSLLSYAALSVFSVIGNYSSSNAYMGSSYLYSLTGKAVGGFIALWLLGIIYFRVKPNKSLQPTPKNGAAEL